METKYSYDSLGAPIEIVDDEPEKVGETFNKKNIYKGDEVLKFETLRKNRGKYIWQEEYLFEDDIIGYIETLKPSEWLEFLKNMDVKEIKEAANMEEVYL